MERPPTNYSNDDDSDWLSFIEAFEEQEDRDDLFWIGNAWCVRSLRAPMVRGMDDLR